MIDLRPWIDRVDEAVASRALASPGAFRRWREADAEGHRDLAANPYGCADAANLLYTIGRLPTAARERAAFVRVLRAFQQPDGGLFDEATHHPIHTTAHCVGALELFDARPAHPLRALASLEEEGALEAFLDALSWYDDPWLASHQGAGVYAARVVAGEASTAWQERYFAWLWRESDPATGLWRRGVVEPPFRWGPNRFPHLAGTFHYLFNLEHARKPLRFPAALVDTCLDLFDTQEWPLGETLSFAEVDWVYCLTRSGAQCEHRRAESETALRGFAKRYTGYLMDLDLATDPAAADLHTLFGAACALAELQHVLPDLLRTDPPLRLVLDRRPFI